MEQIADVNMGQPPDELTSPPKPPLAFRVGVVGHRPNRLGEADLGQLGRVIGGILEQTQKAVKAFAGEHADLFASGDPILRAISPLAEGTDRIFAEQALALGWELCCVMPFAQDEYENDFQPAVALEDDSLQRFRDLRARARVCFQLDGSRAEEAAAYGAGGRVVLNQSDLLIVVWDGQRQDKRGGTEETMDEARRKGVPVLWIEAKAPHTWRWMGMDPEPADISELVRTSLAVPTPSGGASESGREPIRGLLKFYTEGMPRWCIAVPWKAFRDVVGDSRWPRLTCRVPPFEESVCEEWPRDRSNPVAALVDTLRPYYAWTDKLAVLNSDLYRSAFLTVYLGAALAVAMALAPMLWAREGQIPLERLSAPLELGAILGVLLIVLLGRWRRWHERWLDYRLAAELVRHLRVVAPVGGARPFAQVPAHHGTYGSPTATWMDWYVRAVARSAGLPDAPVDRAYLAASLAHLHDLIEGQAGFHRNSARRSHIIERRLMAGVVVALSLTLVACLLHLAGVLSGPMVFLCGALPALGAALAGINNQGEFRRIAKRSGAMEERLNEMLEQVDRLRERIADAPAGEAFANRVRILAQDSAQILVNEVLDWRVVFLDRPLEAAP